MISLGKSTISTRNTYPGLFQSGNDRRVDPKPDELADTSCRATVRLEQMDPTKPR